MPPMKKISVYTPTLLISMGLIAGLVSFSGCTAPLLPSAADDGRNCYLGVVSAKDLPMIRVWAPKAEPGDLLVSQSCDEMQTEELLNDIRRMTHEKP